MTSPTRWQTLTHTLLRVFAAAVYIQHGVQKAMTLVGGQPLGGPLQYTALVIECVGGTMILLGLFTRVVSFIASGEMAVAYFLFHAPRGFWPVVNHGETPVLLCFIFLYLSAVGAGKCSLDVALRRNATG
jgi:putative oxidoreductase